MRKIAGLLLLLGACSDLAPAGDPRVQGAAETYARWGHVEEETHLALAGCLAPPPPPLRKSASRDVETHGKKLYYLFAKDKLAYLHAKDLDQPVGQVLVKESWSPGTERTKGPLFLMIKTGDAESDGGWIYATATADGKTVTSSGRLANCMECHQGAKRDRMFGLSSCASAD